MAGELMPPYAVTAGVLLLAVLIWQGLTAAKIPKGLRLVPGPAGWPIIGHIILPHPAKQLREWAEVYGEVYRMRLLNHDWVMVNSREAVKEIMDKQSGATSSRKPFPVLNDLVSGGMRTLLMEHNLVWRKSRAVLHKLLTPKVSDTFRPSQEFEAKQLMFDYLTDNEDCEKFYLHSRRYTSSIMVTTTYGQRITSWEGSEHIKVIYQVMRELSVLAVPGTFLADTFPSLAKLPAWMQTWRPRAKTYFDNQSNLWMGYWNQLQEDIKNGVAPECFAKQISDSGPEKLGVTELQSAWICGTLLEAGSETTASTINSCIRQLANNPHVQDVANKILTEVVGEERSPSFKDEPQLQYIRATVKEAFRMSTIASIGIAHYSTSDVIYKDYFIPKGTVVALNAHIVHYDDQFSDPFAFRPERYINHDLRAGAYAGMANPLDRDHFGFGAGRRICPGMHLAENSLYITIAKLLWAFEVRPALGTDGKEEVLDTGDESWEEGAIRIPKRFRARFIPRSAEREKIVREEWMAAQRDGYMWGDVRVDKNGMVSPQAESG